MREESKTVNFDRIKSEKGLRTMIRRNLDKEYGATKPSIDFIYKILEDAHNSDLVYDVTNMRPLIQAFAANSTNQSEYCIKLVNKMHFSSEDKNAASNTYIGAQSEMVFYDVEVFPNLFVVCWKLAGEGKPIVRMINPNGA